MRKSQSKLKARLLGAGLTAGAVGAAVLVAPTAAFASVTLSSSTATPGTTITATVNTGVFASTAQPYIVLTPVANTCNADSTVTAAQSGATSVVATETGDPTATFVVPSAATLGIPTGTVSKDFKVCTYAGTTASGATLDAGPTLTVTPSVQTPGGGALGTLLTNKQPNSSYFSGTPGIIFTTNSTCPATYTTSISGQTTAAATNITRVDSTTLTFNTPSNLALDTGGVAKAYKVCYYNGTASSSTAVLDNPQTFVLTPGIGSSATTGPSGGSNTLTFTAPSGSTPFTTASPAVVFSLTGCPATYGSPAAGRIGTSVTKSSTSALTVTVPSGVTGTGLSTPYTACFYGAASTAEALIGASASTYSVNIPAITLSSTVGAAGVTNGITATSSSNFLLGVTSLGANYVTADRCPVTYTAATSGIVEGAANSVRKLANNRLAATVPVLTLTNSSPTVYQACFYNGSSAGQSTLVATAPYTVMNPHTVSSVAPTSGTVLGGTEIVVTGSNFPTTAGSITATLGGMPLLNITPVSPNAFTATTPMHAAENDATLVVTTIAGSRTLANAYSFLNDIVVSPNTAPNTTRAIDLTVKGVGFYGVTFGTAAANAHMYLVNGTYNPSDIGSSTKANGPLSECTDVLVISDSELICTLSLNRRFDASGAAINPTTYAGAATAATTTANSRVITATTGTFKPEDVGLTITHAGAAAGTRIARVLSSTTAVMDRDPIGASATTSLTVGGALRTNATVDISGSGVYTITADAGSFTSADIGRAISGTGLNASGVTFITAVAAGGGSATVSLPTASSQTDTTVSFFNPIAVPNGAFTLTFVTDGSLNAHTNPDYSQSVVSSGSTFTVAPA
ncbi:beta strand repeat-containing protein [Actinoplanes sp. CA-131856]